MKKLLLSVAVLATAALTVNAAVIYDGANFAFDETGNTTVQGPAASLVTVNSTLTVNGADAQFTTINGGEEASVTFSSNFYVSYTNSNPNKKYVKIAKNGNIQYEGKDFYFNFSGLAAGDVITFTDNGGAANAGFYQDGSETPITLSAQNGTVQFTATGSTMTVKTDGTKARISKIETTGAGAGTNDAISSELLNKAGNQLVNPTNLEVTIYSVGGAKVLKSSEASINLSGLASGQYVAVTAQGSLKFIK
jgi:hypothetical protein